MRAASPLYAPAREAAPSPNAGFRAPARLLPQKKAGEGFRKSRF